MLSLRVVILTSRCSSCLLGIFGVHIPMIYGEGGVEAFIRLQKAIMEKSDDHSLFAWKQEHGLPGHGLLASSPVLFSESSSIVVFRRGGSLVTDRAGNIIRSQPGDLSSAYRMTNRGLEIQLNLASTMEGGEHIALLNCRETGYIASIGIYIITLEDGRFVRTRLDQLVKRPWMNIRGLQPCIPQSVYIPQLYLTKKPVQPVYRFQFDEANSEDESYSLWRPLNPSNAVKTSTSTFSSALLHSLWSKVSPVARQGFSFAAATSSGRKLDDTLDYTLKVGGRARLLFVPSRSCTESKPRAMENSPFVATIFGVQLDESIYRDIIEVTEADYDNIFSVMTEYTGPLGGPEPEAIRPATKDWFEKYISNLKEGSPRKEVVNDIWDWRFNLKITPKLGNIEVQYPYRISDRPRGNKQKSSFGKYPR